MLSVTTLKNSAMKVRAVWHTPWFLGVVLLVVGSLGLLRQLIRLLMIIPVEVWISLMMIFGGVMLVGVEAAKELYANQRFHTLPREMMRRSMQMGQRLSILAYDVVDSREEVKIVLSGVSPLLAEVLCSSSALEAFCVVANEVRRLLGYKDDDEETDDRLATAVGWLQRPQLMLGFEDQLRCCALARQATKGDAPKATVPESEQSFSAAQQRSWEMCRGMAKAEASEALLQELADKDPTFRKVVPPAAPEAVPEKPLNDFVQVFCELFEFRLPSDLDARALKLRKRAFWASLAVVFYAVVWRHWVRRKPLTIVRAVTNAGVSTLSTYLAILNLGLPAPIYARLHARLPAWLRSTAGSNALPGAAGRLLRWLLQLLLPPLRRPLMITAGAP